MEHRFQDWLQISLDYHLGDAVRTVGIPNGRVPAPRPSVCQRDAPVAESSCRTTSDSRSDKGSYSNLFRTPRWTAPSTPAAPRLAFTRLYASHTSRLAIQNGFALSTPVIPFQVAAEIKPNDDAPSVQIPLQNLRPYYERLRPCAPHRYSDPRGYFRLGFSLRIGTTGSCVPYRSLYQGHAAFMPDAGWAVAGSPNPCSRDRSPGPGFDVG